MMKNDHNLSDETSTRVSDIKLNLDIETKGCLGCLSSIAMLTGLGYLTSLCTPLNNYISLDMRKQKIDTHSLYPMDWPIKLMMCA